MELRRAKFTLNRRLSRFQVLNISGSNLSSMFQIRLLLVKILNIYMVLSFKPDIQMPFTKISGSSTLEINKIESTLTCDEERNSLEDCATECFERSLTNTGCPGFYVDGSQNENCFLCNISSWTEIAENSYTSFHSDDLLYLLKSKSVSPETTLGFDNYTGSTIYGKKLVGTASGIADSDHVSGINGKALYLHDGGKVFLPGSGTDCWTNLNHCTYGVTISIWFNTKAIDIKSHIISSAISTETGFNIHSDIGGTVISNIVRSTVRYYIISPPTISVSTWYHLTAVYDGNSDLNLYIDSTKQNGTRRTLERTAPTTDHDAYIRVAHTGSFDLHKMNGYVDEFKYFYRMLNSVGKTMSCRFLKQL